MKNPNFHIANTKQNSGTNGFEKLNTRLPLISYVCKIILQLGN